MKRTTWAQNRIPMSILPTKSLRWSRQMPITSPAVMTFYHSYRPSSIRRQRVDVRLPLSTLQMPIRRQRMEVRLPLSTLLQRVKVRLPLSTLRQRVKVRLPLSTLRMASMKDQATAHQPIHYRQMSLSSHDQSAKVVIDLQPFNNFDDLLHVLIHVRCIHSPFIWNPTRLVCTYQIWKGATPLLISSLPSLTPQQSWNP